MSAEIAQIVEQSAPYLTAALGAYGGTVLQRAEDAAAEATADVGRRLLQAIWRRRSSAEQTMLEEAVHEAAEDANDPDAAAALRQQIKRAIREDEELRRELAGLLTSSATLTPIVGSQTATARDRGVVFQQGTGRQTYESK